MSGRLIILPKKTYCPWKPENVERVLRDERQERERLERQEEKQRQVESKRRLQTLKGDKDAINDNGIPEHGQEKHVNLFEPEERAMVEMAVTAGQTTAKLAAATQETKGIMPVRLDSVLEKNQKKRRYNNGRKSSNEEKRKAELDPMKAFLRPSMLGEESEHSRARDTGRNDRAQRSLKEQEDTATDNDGRIRKSSRRSSHKRKRSSRYDSSSDSDGSSARRRSSRRKRRHEKKRRKREASKSGDKQTGNSLPIQELRRRREEREHKESQREAALRQQADSRNDRNRRYQDQYYPTLSRR